MNDAQRRHILAVCRRIDELLAETDDRLGPGAQAALFPAYVADASPIQQKRTGDYAQRLRSAMQAALDRLEIAGPRPSVSAVWSARTLLMTAQVAVADLEPRRLGGYGAVREEDARELRALVADLSNWLDQMEAYLAQGPDETIAARLRRIGVAAPEAGHLAEIERIVSERGLVGIRPSLDLFVQRLADPDFEVAVFGRVKAGKSSLLNRLLNSTALPVGVTPVTEVTMRIVHGPSPIGHAEFTDAAEQRFDLARLAEFVSVQQNPGNLRHVSRLVVELPAPLLADGIAFVDTPGVGLADGMAAAQTWAYLPRCDLGLVLVDAASTLTDEDIALVDALLHAGAAAQVLLAKADLLDGQDLDRMLDFLRRRLTERLGADVPVHPVSSRPSGVGLTDRWLESALRPCLAESRRLAAEARARKFALLRDAVRQALIRRTATTDDEAAMPRRGEWERLSREVLATLDDARHTVPSEIAGLAALAGAVLDEAAHNAAVIWNEHRTQEFDATSFIEAAAQARSGVAGSAAARQLTDLRVLAKAALTEAGGIVADSLPRPSAMPVMDAAGVLPPFVAHRSILLSFASETALRLALRHWMREKSMDRQLADAFRNYAHRLDVWRLAAQDELKTAFLAQRDLMAEDAGKGPATVPDVAQDIRTLDAMGLDIP